MVYLEKVSNGIFKFLSVFLFIILSVMTIAGFLQVFSRYVLKVPLPWTEELTRYLFVWLTFIGSAAAVKKKAHIAMDLLVEALPGISGKLVKVITEVVFLLFCVFLAYDGFFMAFKNWTQRSDAMALPMTLPYLAIPIGGALMAFFLLEIILKEFSAKSEKALNQS